MDTRCKSLPSNKMSEPFNRTSNDNATNSAAGVVFVAEPLAMRVVRLTLFGVLFLTAGIGNVVVFCAPLRNRRLRTFSYCLISNLAVSDFLSVLAVPPLLVDEQLGAGWIFGEFLCRFLNPTQVVCGMVTTNVHVAIAVDRYLSIIHPFKYKPPSSNRTSLVAGGLVWLMALLCALPAYSFRQLQSVTFKSGLVRQLCLEVFPPMGDSENGFRNLYSVFLFCVNYFVPITVSTALYANIVHHLKRAELRRRQNRRKTSVASNRSQDERSSTYLERRFITMAFIVVLIFLLCYLPYQIVFLLFEFDYDITWRYTGILLRVVYFMTWLPNALNPICYGAMDKHYSKAFKKLCSSFHADRNSGTLSGSFPREKH